ncbi:PREDICTED: trypsin-1-like [Habropoda laboriosa]|uniref:trypsin-1-like n=1 Tax=Habropoda laboriosa TaxID=597456 RepID=UPI00083D9452|nr:PREDICTED: trypsin-1-like [Habropoda laboriosa]
MLVEYLQLLILIILLMTVARTIMCINKTFYMLVVVAVICATNCEEVSNYVIKEETVQPTLYNSTAVDDKNFWEWLYGFVSTANPIITTELPRPVQPLSCLPCKCGLTNTQKRIVGGIETQVNQYPWMALMMFRGRFYCGGSVISSRYVLTAAHCVDRFDPNLISVRILEHDRNSTTETETEVFQVETVIKHSGYSTYNYNNDIALVKLKDGIRFEGKMRPVCLPERAKTFSGINGTVTGWGAIEESGVISQTLQEYPARRITDNMLCAGYKEGSKDSCQGDSGGPLHIVNEQTYDIVGIVSWGEGCAKPGYPGVYSRVNRYLTWIKRNTEDSCYC